MAMDPKKKRELRALIKKLKGIRGRHTELVSVYVPASYNITKIINHLSEEQHTASNIKDKRTRTNVQDSLERIIRHLRLFKKTPENGFAVFAGNISEKESQVDIQVFSIEPPDPLNIRIYRCDQTFVVDILEDMVEEKETYGLLVVDKREATMGMLKGKNITELASFTSNVPGKTTKGGQCLVPNSVVQIADGDLEKIGNLHNPYVVKSAEFEKGDLIDSPVTDKWDSNKLSLKIITKHPRLEIESSPEHTFFVRSEKGIIEKSAEELKEGDFLLMPEQINVGGKIQELNFGEIKFLNEKFAQFLGYYLGDGNSDTNRLVFYEGNEELAFYYKNFFDNLFGLDTRIKFRESKNYWEIRIYSKKLFDFVSEEFPEIDNALNSEVPKKILKSPDEVVSGFLKGLFDAEGYVTDEELSIGMNNKYLIQQIQMMLLRFGIISGFGEYDNLRNPYSDNHRYNLRITERKSLKIFRDEINFNYNLKKDKLGLLINKRGIKSNVRQIIENGKEIRKLLESYGYLKENFKTVSNFFYNQREMSKDVFMKNFIEKIDNEELLRKLKLILNYNLVPVKVKSIEKSNKLIPMADISVKNQNFIANCVLVHNSQQRYARIREEAAHEFYKRISRAVNEEFGEMTELKGILLGGPGMTKEEFLDGDYLHTRVKNKVIGVKDLSYTGEFGLKELVDKSYDVLSAEGLVEEKKIMERFFNALSTKGGNKAVYKEEDVLKALEMGAADVVLVSEDIEDAKLEDLEEKAERIGAVVKIISLETTEGQQLKEFGGVAAILRFNI